MKFIFILFLTAVTPVLFAQNFADNKELPFAVEVEEVKNISLPGIHSGAFAQYDAWWILIGGRINGLHGFFAATAFPEDQANTAIWLLNPLTGETKSYPVSSLSVPYKSQLTSTNPQYVQHGKYLYITGGYGKDMQTNKFVTFPIFSAIDLSVLIQKILSNQNPSIAIDQIVDENMRVCGGEMERLGDYYYLIGGHNFSGLYTEDRLPTFTQVYSNEMKKFRILHASNQVTIDGLEITRDETHLHRRDFNLGPIVHSGGKPGLGIYGGVFKPEADVPYTYPLYLFDHNGIKPDSRFEQSFSQYTCPVIPLYNAIDGSMYTIFFAGLSDHFVDAANNVKYDGRVPFIKDVTAIRRKSDGTTVQYILPFKFDAYLGTNMVFVPNENVSQYENAVIKLEDIRSKTFVGYLYGGIKADIPNITPSRANSRLFKVFITRPTATTAKHDQNHLAERIRLFPNPSTVDEVILIEADTPLKEIYIYDALGKKVYGQTFINETTLSHSISFAHKSTGIYYLSIHEKTGMIIKKISRIN